MNKQEFEEKIERTIEDIPFFKQLSRYKVFAHLLVVQKDKENYKQYCFHNRAGRGIQYADQRKLRKERI